MPMIKEYVESVEARAHFDSFTAASNGDLTYFTKCSVGSTDKFSSSNQSGWTPIMYACSKGHALLVSYLIMCGVKTNCSTQSNVTPLMLAIGSCDFPTVECIFNAADLEKKDYKMWTPLFYAVHFMQIKIVRFLLSKGAKVNITDFQNETPLLIAIKSGNEVIVELLLKTADNLHVTSYKNESAIMLAEQSGSKEIRDMVLSRRDYLKCMEGSERPPPKVKTPVKCRVMVTEEKLSASTPTPVRKASKMKSFLGLSLKKSLTYSPNGRDKSRKEREADASPVSAEIPTSLWKMCIMGSPIPSTVQYDVEMLLSSLGLEEYWPIFRDEEVDFETLLMFTEENLLDIGIECFGPRKKILMAINGLRPYHFGYVNPLKQRRG